MFLRSGRRGQGMHRFRNGYVYGHTQSRRDQIECKLNAYQVWKSTHAGNPEGLDRRLGAGFQQDAY